MSFAGHVFDMLKRQAANRAMQLQNRERFRNKNVITHPKESTYISETNIVQTKTLEELDASRQITLKEIRVYNRIVWIKTTITFLLIIILLVYLLG